MRLFVSQTNDPFLNLAFEETLLREKDGAAFLWVNDPCVVIGRNQDPFHETDPAFLEAHGIALARRLSGGGAVYHDKGNLNYSIVSESSDENRAANWALSALDKLGIRACVTGRNDIVIGSTKIGGFAERYDERFLQHGTLLVDVDMHMLAQTLRPSALKLKKHGIASVKSRVANLSSFAKDIDISRLMDSFEDVLGVSPELPPICESTQRRACELRSPSWVFGTYATGDAEFETLVDGDLYRFSLDVDNGIVQFVRITTDACQPLDLNSMTNQIAGRPLQEVSTLLRCLK